MFSSKNSGWLILSLFTALTQAHAYDLSLLKNDKEMVSHAYGNIRKAGAIRRAKEHAELAYHDFGNSINELESLEKTQYSEQLCELGLFQHFSNKLKSNLIPSDSKSIQDLLIVWRSDNLIDDLLFEIIEQTAEASESMKDFHADQPSSKEIEKMKALIAEKEITAFDLSMFYESFKNASLTSSGCTLSAWNRLSQQLLEISKAKHTLRLINIAALEQKAITPAEFELVEFYRTEKIQTWTLDLKNYLKLISTIKNKSIPGQPSESDLLPNELSSKLKKKTGKGRITYRKSIYSRFNFTQIMMIEQILKKTFDRMDATKTEVVFTFKEGSETVPVSPMGQYYLARRLLRKEMDDLNRSTFFIGNPVTHEDLIAVSLETGLINAGILESTLKIDDLWNPEIKPWKKIVNYAFRVTGTATIFLPPPYNVISSIALVFVDGIVSRQSRKASQSEADYDFF